LADHHEPAPRPLRAHRHDGQRAGRFNAQLQLVAYQFWRGVFVQKQVAKLAETAIDFPPMQKGASFNLEAVKAQVEKTIAAHTRGN
jgi:hypothetical protein